MKGTSFFLLTVAIFSWVQADNWRLLYCNGKCSIKATFPENFAVTACQNFNGTLQGFRFQSSLGEWRGLHNIGRQHFFLGPNCSGPQVTETIPDNSCRSTDLTIEYYGAKYRYSIVGYGLGEEPPCFTSPGIGLLEKKN